MAPVLKFPHLRCHAGRISAPGRPSAARTPVWVCEYPYRSIRATGPSADCEGCPVWSQLAGTFHQPDGTSPHPPQAA